jgi:hypothetical protein
MAWTVSAVKEVPRAISDQHKKSRATKHRVCLFAFAVTMTSLYRFLLMSSTGWSIHFLPLLSSTIDSENQLRVDIELPVISCLVFVFKPIYTCIVSNYLCSSAIKCWKFIYLLIFLSLSLVNIQSIFPSW